MMLSEVASSHFWMSSPILKMRKLGVEDLLILMELVVAYGLA